MKKPKPIDRIKQIDFFKTYRFRIIAWFFTVTVLLTLLMLVGINSAMEFSREDDQPPFGTDTASWQEKLEAQREEFSHNLKVYSTIGAAWVIMAGSVGIYALSKDLVKPINEITSLVSRISRTNLSERINYVGPDDEIKYMADTFDNMLERLEQSFNQQQEFIQNASHELRTPIAIALTNIEVEEMNPNPTIKEYKELSNTIKTSLIRMNAINNNLLILSEGNQPNRILSRVDINQILKELVAEMKNAAAQEEVTIISNIPDSPLIVNGDIMRLRQCFFNLIENGIKYNKKGGEIHIRVSEANSCAVIDIADTGIGIPEEAQKEIFRRFYRVDKSRSREKGGSGLGLSIVEKIINDHGGRVTVSSRLGEGSIFHVILPMDDNAVNTSATADIIY